MPAFTSQAGARGLLAVLVFVTAGVAQAQAPLAVTGAWVREPVPGRRSTAAYAVFENGGPSEVQIVAATADVAGVGEIHEMMRSGDMMRMAPVKSLTIPSRGKVELRPGGLHVMLFDLNKPIKEGDTVTLTFETSSGATVQATAPVRKAQMP
jgi:copper(I)-binding protein